MKAIHNLCDVLRNPNDAVFNISKIQNESNSQLFDNLILQDYRCVQYIKDTKWKQFTTHKHTYILHQELCSIYQRYKMKAIHNRSLSNNWNDLAVFNISKIQNESNSQPLVYKILFYLSCVQYIKDTKWKQFTTTDILWCFKWVLCSIYQRYKMKAIHNSLVDMPFRLLAVFNISKIQNESNSQRSCFGIIYKSSCVQYIKDTKWKQFTTIWYRYLEELLLCSIYQRYKMKAIHNQSRWWNKWDNAVFNISKIQNESNSQRC